MNSTDKRIVDFGYKDLDELMKTLVDERQKIIRFEIHEKNILKNIENVEANLTSFKLFFENIRSMMGKNKP